LLYDCAPLYSILILILNVTLPYFTSAAVAAAAAAAAAAAVVVAAIAITIITTTTIAAAAIMWVHPPDSSYEASALYSFIGLPQL